MSKENVSKEKKTIKAIVKEPSNEDPKALELAVLGPKVQEQKQPDVKLHETKKPENLRANAMPINGYVLSIDGKLKARYESSNDAMAAGMKLKQSYPVIQVAVYDATEKVYSPVELPGAGAGAAGVASAEK